ncbi:MAG: S-layer homology domain-containing protein [Bacillota bacterium]|nr:S-layer homology domain-containing protein [Bacillota bacterium]
MKRKKLSFVLITALIAVGLLSGFTTYDGLGEVHSESTQNIGPGTSYTSIVGKNYSSGSIVSAHVIDADVASGKVRPYVYNGLVRKTYTVSSMSNIITNEGYKVVAGINGDIYDTSSGTPKGAVIHDGILYTGGYQSQYLISFDKSGKASVSNQTISYKLDYQKYVYKEAEIPAESGSAEGGGAEDTESGAGEGSASGGNTVTETTIENATASIGYFNVPHGGSNALHIFNSRYADNTKTTGTCAEAVLKIKDGTRADLKVGSSVTAEVVSVNSNTKSTPIADNQFVLSANSASASYNDICSMVPGSEVKITVSTDSSSPINNAVEAMGIYNVLAYNGELWTTDTTLNPRTCIGIKENGSLVLYAVDGRQSSVSKGMNGVDAAKYLMSLGCVTVVNMDGGGSTTMVARDEPGKSNSAKLVNSPSDGSLRSVTNGIFLVYTTVASDEAVNIAVYPENTVMMPGMSVQLSSYGMNSLYEKAELDGDVTYKVDSVYGSVDSKGVFTSAPGSSGEAVITASGGKASGTAKATIVNDVTFSVNKTSAVMTPGETYDFNVTKVMYGNVSALYKDSLFTWSCTPEIGTVDSNGLFKATDKAGDFSGEITVSYGSRSVKIPVQIKYSGGFTDVDGHWAKQYIVNLADEGIIKGMTETTFEPDSGLTRAQFLTLLANIAGEGAAAGSGSLNFTDVPAGSWYYDCISWGVSNGIVKGMGDGTFAPDAKVNREQMCVMLCNYYNYKGLAWEQPEKSLAFPDNSKMSDWAVPSIKKVVNEGIMSGRTDGTFDPLGNATRGEAAKIIYLVKEIYYYQMSN